METIIEHLWYFIIYSSGGWLCECLYCGIPAKRFINRGFLWGPYCPIYGCGALLVLWFLMPFANQPVWIFLFGMLVTSLLEYVTSWGMECLFHTTWWDYSNRYFHINGRVCLRNSLLFGLMALIVMYWLHPTICTLIERIPTILFYGLPLLYIAGFSYDLYHTITTLLHQNKRFLAAEETLCQLKECLRQMDQTSNAPLHERIRMALASTDTDERLLSILRDALAKTQRSEAYEAARQRLKKAFPNQHLHTAYASLAEWLELLEHHRKAKKR